jgi:predicted transposase/invertase (TIGR01784 family)
MEDLLHQSHDKFFKAVFSEGKVAQEHLTAFLPPAIAEHLALDKMTLDTTAYISKRFKSFQSDVVWSVPYKDGKVKIVLLYEHKTAYDRHIHFQVLRYMLEIWEHCIKKKKPLEIIIPVVVYQGVGNWEKIDFQDLFAVQDAELLRFLPVFDYILNQTTPESEARLWKGNSLQAYLAFRTMRQVAEEALSADALVVFIQEIADIMDSNAINGGLTSRIYTYIFGNTEADYDNVMATVHISNQQKNNVMSVLHQLYHKGEAVGISLGKAEGITIGEQKGLLLTAKIIKLHTRGFDAAAIAEKLETEVATVNTAITEYEAD